MKQDNGEDSSEDLGLEVATSDEITAAKMASLLSGKKREWEAVKKKTRPLRLLDLPVDILRLIVKEAS